MDEMLARAVVRRARGKCEYCRLPAAVHPTPFEIEHIISKQHRGSTMLSNLAYSRLHCNRHKGPNISGILRRWGRRLLVPLFNPRRHKWERHFRWEGPYLGGRTAIGGVTIEVLAINDHVPVAVRQALMEDGLFF